MPLRNPYHNANDKPLPSGKAHKLTALVSTEDFYFVKTRFCLSALSDNLVSTLFKTLVDELRAIDAVTPLDPAWYVDHPNYTLLDLVIRRIRQGSVGRNVGDETGNDDGRPARSDGETVQSTAVECSDSKGNPRAGRRRKKVSTEEKG